MRRQSCPQFRRHGPAGTARNRCDGNRDTLTVVLRTKDDKLAALMGLGNPWGVDFISMEVWADQFFLDDFKQVRFLF